MPLLDVADIASLEALNNVLNQYREQSLATVQGFVSILSNKVAELERLESHFAEKVRRAEAALRSCEISRSSDPPDSRRSCSSQEAALARAQAKYSRYQSIMAHVRQAVAEYKGSEGRYNYSLNEISAATVPLLSQFITLLRKYASDEDIAIAGMPVSYVATGSGAVPETGNTAPTGTLSGGNESGTSVGQAGMVADNVPQNNASNMPSGNGNTANNGSSVPNDTKPSVSPTTAAVAGGGAMTAIVAGGFLINTLKKGKKGMSRNEITMLQELLKEKGYKIEADGVFGNKTDEAVKKFQKVHGLKVDGEVGEKTISALKKDKYIITYSELKSIFPKGKKDNLIALESYLVTEGKKYGLTDKQSIALYLAQVGHESGGFTSSSEGLNYTPKKLSETFKAFHSVGETDAKKKEGKYDPELYGRIEKNGKITQKAKQEDIANIAYSNIYKPELGNGNIESKEGYKYKGRGFMQITGKDNYSNLSNFWKKEYPNEKDIDFVASPELLEKPKYAAISSFRYWKNNVVDTLGTQPLTVDNTTAKVNSAKTGLKERKEIFEKVSKIFGLNKK